MPVSSVWLLVLIGWLVYRSIKRRRQRRMRASERK